MTVHLPCAVLADLPNGVTMSQLLINEPNHQNAIDWLKRQGNPFRNYFARNPDDEVCSIYHVPELYSREREQLLRVVDQYRYTPNTHSEVVPILGNKGAGKTHLLHSIKHGMEGNWQLLVTPGSYQRDTDFLEYLLFQLLDTLLGGGKQRNSRPLEYVGEQLIRMLLTRTLADLSSEERLDLFPPPGLGWIAKTFGLGSTQALERTQWLIDALSRPSQDAKSPGMVRKLCDEAGLTCYRAFELVCEYVDRTSGHDAAAMMRHAILQGFARSVLLQDETELASFLTYGFAELDFKMHPGRQDLVLALFKAMMGVMQELRIPVVIAFDQLEDLLLARRNDDAHKTAETFFAGIVKAMHQLDGISFLVFAERGLWNRFIPSLDGYIQDRLNNPVHVPGYGTIKCMKLDAPPFELVRKVVLARLEPALRGLPNFKSLPEFYPFTLEQIDRIARTEPTLRDMLQQFRHFFDKIVYGAESESINEIAPSSSGQTSSVGYHVDSVELEVPQDQLPAGVRSMVILDTTPEGHMGKEAQIEKAEQRNSLASSGEFKNESAAELKEEKRIQELQPEALSQLWAQEFSLAKEQLTPEGALAGATKELQAGLGCLLHLCHDQGIKVGPWRLQHVVSEWTFGDHPTYGAITLAHWVCRDGQPWKVGIGLFLANGQGKSRDLSVKLSAWDLEPAVIDHLILLRPEADMMLVGKGKQAWQDMEKKGRHSRMEPLTLDGCASLYAFPRILASLAEGLVEGQPLPNLANLVQEKCEKLLEQICMPVQGE
jgi:hypothetical protein